MFLRVIHFVACISSLFFFFFFWFSILPYVYHICLSILLGTFYKLQTPKPAHWRSTESESPGMELGNIFLVSFQEIVMYSHVWKTLILSIYSDSTGKETEAVSRKGFSRQKLELVGVETKTSFTVREPKLLISDKVRDVNHNSFHLLHICYMPDSRQSVRLIFLTSYTSQLRKQIQSSPRNSGSEWQRDESIPILPDSRDIQEGWCLFLKWIGRKPQILSFGGLPSGPVQLATVEIKQNENGNQYLSQFSSPSFRTPSVLYTQCSISKSWLPDRLKMCQLKGEWCIA